MHPLKLFLFVSFNLLFRNTKLLPHSSFPKCGMVTDKYFPVIINDTDVATNNKSGSFSNDWYEGEVPWDVTETENDESLRYVENMHSMNVLYNKLMRRIFTP